MDSWHIPSLDALLTRIEGTKDGTGSWIRYPGAWASLQERKDLLPLTDAITQARTLRGLEPHMARIQAILQDITAHVPAPQTLIRRPVWKSQGSTLSPHRVLRGSSTPWKARTPARVPRHGKIVTLCVDACFPYTVTSEEIAWTSSATLAYASALEHAGYRVNLYAVLAGSDLLSNSEDWLVTLKLKDAAAPWSIQAMAVVTDPSFLRRLMFRWWETLATPEKPTNPTYGVCESNPRVIRARLAQVGLVPDLQDTQLVLGANMVDHIEGLSTACAWYTKQLATLAA